MITLHRYRMLLIAYAMLMIVLWVYGAALPYINPNTIDSSAILKMTPDQRSQFNSDTMSHMIASIPVMVVSVLSLILSIVAWLGLFVTQRLARSLFALSITMYYGLNPFLFQSLRQQLVESQKNLNLPPPNFSAPPFITVLGYLVLLLSGCILTIIFTDLGKHLFEHSPPASLRPTADSSAVLDFVDDRLGLRDEVNAHVLGKFVASGEAASSKVDSDDHPSATGTSTTPIADPEAPTHAPTH